MKLLQLIEDQLVVERYLGMADVDREDIGQYVRKRLSVALRASLDSKVDAERLLNINPQKIARRIYEDVKSKKPFLLVIHGYTKEVSEDEIDSGKAKRVEHTFLITNVFKIAKKINLELANAGSSYVYVIDDLHKEYASVSKHVATVSSMTALIKDSVKYSLSAYQLFLKDTGTIVDGGSDIENEDDKKSDKKKSSKKKDKDSDES